MYFSNLKEKRQKAYRIESYDELLTNIVTTMFAYGGEFPDELTPYIQCIDIYRILGGAAAIWKNEGKFIITNVDFGDVPDPYGIGTLAICSTCNGIVKQFPNWRENPEIAVFFNNSLWSPDMSIGRFSDAFAELEVSLKLNVLFSRMYPIPVCADNKSKKSIEEAIKSAMDGKISTILSPDALSKYVDGNTGSGVDLVNITDVEKSSYIQYLAKYRDDLLRWFLSQYGMNSQGSSKMAQQTVDEVNQDSNSSLIIPHDMLKQAKLGCDMCNQKFGWNMSVEFSECWRSRDEDINLTDEEVEGEPEAKPEAKQDPDPEPKEGGAENDDN